MGKWFDGIQEPATENIRSYFSLWQCYIYNHTRVIPNIVLFLIAEMGTISIQSRKSDILSLLVCALFEELKVIVVPSPLSLFSCLRFSKRCFALVLFTDASDCLKY